MLASAPGAQVLWDADFSQRPEGAYALEAAKADFGPFIQYAKVPAGRARIKLDAGLGRKVLEVRYPKGCVGPDDCAMQVRAIFPVQQSAWMRYRVRFEAGFDWRKGGKLPGLCGGKCNTGCMDVTGADGWSARLMWHDNAKLVQYMYYPDGTANCGTDFAYNAAALATGRWYEVINQVVLNTPGASGGQGKPDGIVRAWVDGKLVLERTDVRFRDASAVALNQFYFSTFHGGDAPDWGPAADSYASFADIVVTATDPRLNTSSLPSPRTRREGDFRIDLDRGWLRVSPNAPGKLKITVIDPDGRRLQFAELQAGDVDWVFRPLRPGLYLLRWENLVGSGARPITVL